MKLSVEFVNIIKKFKEEHINELYQNQGVAISVFRLFFLNFS